MSTSTITAATPLPPLPPDTAGKWLHVTTEDLSMVQRFLNVMYRMDDRYRRDSIRQFSNWPGHLHEDFGGAYYYWTADSEVVVRFDYFRPRKQFEFKSVGFVGSLTPAAALDLMIDKAVEFLRAHGATSGFAIRPKHMQNPQIMQLHDMVLQNPRLRVTVEKDAPNDVRWNIELLELLQP